MVPGDFATRHHERMRRTTVPKANNASSDKSILETIREMAGLKGYYISLASELETFSIGGRFFGHSGLEPSVVKQYGFEPHIFTLSPQSFQGEERGRLGLRDRVDEGPLFGQIVLDGRVYSG